LLFLLLLVRVVVVTVAAALLSPVQVPLFFLLPISPVRQLNSRPFVVAWRMNVLRPATRGAPI
jgi:hypothetical protein